MLNLIMEEMNCLFLFFPFFFLFFNLVDSGVLFKNKSYVFTKAALVGVLIVNFLKQVRCEYIPILLKM